ncbi:HI1506-related protein [Pseudomonas taetrolens]|uniref:HI1506-related protein n=1 Tax=Pseudomonas taetrolens TaxID=47884 RepID=UPI0030D917C7
MAIFIAAKRHGFRRCGIAHSSEPTLYRDDHFTSAQLQALVKDPQLVVSYADADLDDQQELPNETAPYPLLPEAAIAIEGAMPGMGQADPAAMGDAGPLLQDGASPGHDRPSLIIDKAYMDIEGLWDEALAEEAQREDAKVKPADKSKKTTGKAGVVDK